ncbi:MAG: PKD domain-containing protein [Candidatus Bipolaricaulota bacterium]
MRKAIPVVLLMAVAAVLTGCWRQELPAGDIVTTPYPPEGPRPLEVEFDASGFGGNDIVEYQWDFDDGTTANGPEASHTYKERGTYTVQLTVVDERNRKSTAQTEVIVRRKPPVAEFTMDASYGIVVSPRTVYFDATASHHPDGGEIVEYQWDFGDGTVNVTSEPTVAHRYVVEGSYTREYTIELRVVDDDGNVSVAPPRQLSVLPGCPSCS